MSLAQEFITESTYVAIRTCLYHTPRIHINYYASSRQTYDSRNSDAGPYL